MVPFPLGAYLTWFSLLCSIVKYEAVSQHGTINDQKVVWLCCNNAAKHQEEQMCWEFGPQCRYRADS